MARVISRKPYYALAELCERWSLSVADIAAYALEGELLLSIPVAALPFSVSDIEHDADGKPFHVPCGKRWHVGTIDLHRIDAFAVLEGTEMPVARFLSPAGGLLEPLSDTDERAQILVNRAILVVRHAEIERFEAAQAALPSLDSPMSSPVSRGGRGRGAPFKYDWEGGLCEMVVVVNDEGVPETQAELTRKMRDWFAKTLGPDNLPCDSSIERRISRFWSRIKPDVGKPSALRSVHDVLREKAPEKKRRTKP